MLSPFGEVRELDLKLFRPENVLNLVKLIRHDDHPVIAQFRGWLAWGHMEDNFSQLIGHGVHELLVVDVDRLEAKPRELYIRVFLTERPHEQGEEFARIPRASAHPRFTLRILHIL